MQKFIVIKGASEHNLKKIDVSIPRNKITVITGPSGSGKSSLAMDTIYAESQRRYVESLSQYARQFIEQLKKPEVEYISGLSPAIAIDQKTVTKSPRSTVGTITEIYDYMRVIYTRIGIPYCYKCGSEIKGQNLDSIIDSIKSLPHGTRIQVLSQIVRERKGEYRKELDRMREEGFLRARIDGRMVELTQDLKLKKTQRHTIEIVIDRLIVKPGIERHIESSLEIASRFSDIIIVNLVDQEKDILFSKRLACQKCGIGYPEINPMLFSFNSPYGACPHCKGIGYEEIIETFKSMEDEYSEFEIPDLEVNSLTLCHACRGMRLRKEALGIKIGGLNISEFSKLTINDAIGFINSFKSGEREMFIISRPLKEVKERLRFIREVGLGYLTLDRPSLTLSGGEAQRIRLATQIGSRLTGVTYILDEPSIGLHPRDCDKLLNTLYEIRDRGNTVIVVEHDEETIRKADFIVDMGPGGGIHGGELVAIGAPSDIEKNKDSLTGRYLSGELSIHIPQSRRSPFDYIEINGAKEFNLKNIDVKIPIGVFVCVTGVSGSGKSTLIIDILYKALLKILHKSSVVPGRHERIIGAEKIKRVACVDQKPIGRNPKSNPATYTGLFSYIRELFSQIPEARMRGYGISRFSFNRPGGRCEECGGDGVKKIVMHFLPDVYVPCDGCKGRRYNDETLEIRYRDKNIADVLDMTVSEALEFFRNIPLLRHRLEILNDVGLGYIKLGQSVTTLSGGEAQRIRLSKELVKKTKGGTLYILDEPTTGLHFSDIERLLDILNRLVDSGNTVIVIEHNLDIIKSADYIIDMGPEGGDAGGRIVAEGTPEDIADNSSSWTGRYLREKLYVKRTVYV